MMVYYKLLCSHFKKSLKIDICLVLSFENNDEHEAIIN